MASKTKTYTIRYYGANEQMIATRTIDVAPRDVETAARIMAGTVQGGVIGWTAEPARYYTGPLTVELR